MFLLTYVNIIVTQQTAPQRKSSYNTLHLELYMYIRTYDCTCTKL